MGIIKPVESSVEQIGERGATRAQEEAYRVPTAKLSADRHGMRYYIKRLQRMQILSRFVLRNHVFSIKTSHKCIAFTFDDGPSEQITRDLVDLFEENEGKATFFFQGDKAEQYGDCVRYAAEHHFTVANHSYNHPRYVDIPCAEVMQQIERTNKILKDITGARPTMLRPPQHAVSQWQALMIRIRCNQLIIGCNIAPTDWALSSPDDLAEFLIHAAQPGAIVCIHDGYPNTLNALRKALPALHSEGFELLSMDEMLEVGSVSPYRNININHLHS
ncbi:MAG: polysaccharide deacetylase family protein [Akkermansia sp.]|nr:polysaccharide deacetylase family protein [Akkermansia sp.]